jgi:hypothetical protein
MVRRWTRRDDLDIEYLEPKDKRLGRHKVHDPKSKAFARLTVVNQALWFTHSIRIYDPVPNPNQPVGNCTTCAKAMQMNAVGNRVKGVVLDMNWALAAYRIETALDEFAGAWEPDDTGSSGLASCKTAIKMDVGGGYSWIMNGADGIVQAGCEGHVVSVGTKWYSNMFEPDAQGRIEPGGSLAGGHQYVVRSYDHARDWVLVRCWWGVGFRDVWLKREHLNDLVMDGGDAHIQYRLTA